MQHCVCKKKKKKCNWKAKGSRFKKHLKKIRDFKKMLTAKGQLKTDRKNPLAHFNGDVSKTSRAPPRMLSPIAVFNENCLADPQYQLLTQRGFSIIRTVRWENSQGLYYLHYQLALMGTGERLRFLEV